MDPVEKAIRSLHRLADWVDEGKDADGIQVFHAVSDHRLVMRIGTDKQKEFANKYMLRIHNATQ